MIGDPVRLHGRDVEVELLRSFVGSAAARGAALLLLGPPGMGKTTLLDAAAERASGAGSRVLRTWGVEFEADIGFGALNQLLLPLLDDLDELEPVHRDALEVALGFGVGPPPDRLVVSTATVQLLRRHAAAAGPLLLVADDVQWLDRPSADVLSFLGRRLDGSRVGLLAAARTGEAPFLDRAGMPTHELAALDDDAAGALLADRFPALAAPVRGRLLAEARGNPLAVEELPTGLSDLQLAAMEALPPALPLSSRLESLFGARLSGLPAPTRRLLLVAALAGSGEMSLLRAAAGAAPADLAPAEDARVAFLDHGSRRVRFRHPLIRAAVVARAGADERRAAHRELASALVDQPERRAWHLAEATVEPDEQVAAVLDESATRALRRGDTAAAVSGLTRAASLSPEPAVRGRRLARAAYIGANTGRLATATRLLAAARAADPAVGGSLQEASTAAYLLMNGDGDVDTAHRLLVASIESYRDPADPHDPVLVEALHTLFLVCLLGCRAPLWGAFRAGVARLRPPVPPALLLRARFVPDPARTTAADLAELDAAISGLRDDPDPINVVRIAICAGYYDRLTACREALRRVISRSDGTGTAVETNARRDLALDHLHTGQWEECEQVATRGLELERAHGPGLGASSFTGLLAQLAAVRGDVTRAHALADELVGWGVPRGAHSARYTASQVRACTALGQGDVEEAYHHLVAVSPPGVLASHVPLALGTAMDLVEAAVRTDRRAEARVHAAELRRAGVAALSPRLALLVAGASALAADEGSAAGLFAAAVARPGADRWPFDLARVQLAFGEHLRRAGAASRSRTQLAAALGTFERLGARPWAERAAGELRATGQTRLSGDDLGPDALTPQEREVALLAASGLTNKQIGERLFLSPRTVANHLHRAFPKLGVASRAGLRDALTPRS